MEIKETTKYNVGDVLYNAPRDGDIRRMVIESIKLKVTKNDISVMYQFQDGSLAYEDTMYDYATSLEGAANIIAQRAIDKFKKEEE